MMVLEPKKGVFLVPLLVPGLWLELTCSDDGGRSARWVLGKKVLRTVPFARA